MANIVNVVGQKTIDYLNKNKLNGAKNMKQLQLPKAKTETTETIETTETAVSAIEAKTVSRKINGIVKKLTPTENFIHAADKRLQYFDYQFELLGKTTGNQFEYTNEMVDVIESEILDMASKALDSLRNPKTIKKVGKSFATKLRKA